MHQRPDGIVDFASDACIGCKGCTQACPYDAIHMEPESHTAAKCNFCAHRVDVGLEPACVVVCPAHAILAGDLDDPASEVARAVARRDVSVRRPEQGTAPKLFYVDGHAPSLHPTAAGHGRSFSAAEVRAPTAVVEAPEAQGLPAGGPIAAAMIRVSYGAQHDVQWHWPIPAYLITKHLAGGGFFFLAVAALVGRVPAAAMTWGGLFGLVMTFVTLGLLIYDLDRPDRFLYLLTRPQWRSWIARAAWLLTAFTALAVAWWTVELVAPASALRPLFAALVAPVALLTSIYSAFLLAQAEGRDLWQSAHLPVLMTAQGVALGAALARRYMLVPTICFNCESACGLLAYVDKTTLEIKKFEGNPKHPGSRGRNCAKGPATHNQIYDPERILYPLKRVGARGEGKWKRITWDEASAKFRPRCARAA
jgi:ferredoxin